MNQATATFSLDGYLARNKSKMSVHFVWHVCQSTFSAVRAVLYSRTTFSSNSTSSSDQKVVRLTLLGFWRLPFRIWHFFSNFKSNKLKIGVLNSPNTSHVWSYEKKNKLRAGFCGLVFSPAHAQIVFHERVQIYPGTCGRAKTIWTRLRVDAVLFVTVKIFTRF